MASPIEELFVRLGIDTGTFVKQVDTAVDGATSRFGKIGSFLTSSAAKWGMAIAGAGGAFASWRGLEDAIGKTQELGLSVAKLSRETGLSTEDASRLLFAFKHVGLGADDASRSIGIFAKKLKGVSDEETGVVTGGKSTAQILADIGVKATDASGNLLGITDILIPLADQFQRMPDGLEKTGLAMQLFGRSGKDMIPLLNMGSEGLRELSAEADKLGVTLSGANVASIKAFTFAQRDMQEAIAGVKLQIGLALMPVLTRLIDWFIGAQPTIRQFVGTVIDGFGRVVEAVKPVGDLIGDFFGLFDRKDRMAIFAALFAALVAGFLAVAAAAVVAFIAENAALLGIPIAVAAAIAAITLLVRHWDAVWAALQAAPAAILNWLQKHWSDVILGLINPSYVFFRHFKALWSAIFQAMPGPVQAAMNAVAGIIETAVNWILDRLADLLEGLNFIASFANKVLGKIGLEIPDLSGAIEKMRAGVSLQLEVAVKPAVEGVQGLKLAAENFKRQADETIPSVDELGLDLGDLGGSAGAAAEKVAEVVDVLEDGMFSLKEAQEKGVPAWAAARFEMEATAKTLADEVAEKAWRAQVELSKLALSLGDAGVSKAAFDFAVLAGILSGELKDTGTALEGFIQDGIISLKEQLVLGLNPAQAAAIELARERFTAEQAAAEATNRGNVELVKLATAMGERGVTGAALDFALGAKEATEGTLTLKRALELGLTPAEAALTQGVADAAKAQLALKDAIYNVMVQMATFTVQLTELPGPIADSVRELYNLGVRLGNEGLGRQALDFELAMQAVHSSFGDARRAAADFAYGIGVELVNQLQSALGQLLGGGTVETAQLQLEIDTLAYQLAVQEAAGATEEQTQAIRDQIAALQAQQDIYTAEHRVMQDRATLADQTLPTERELKDMVGEITEKIRTESGRVQDLIRAVELQTTATTNAKDQAQRFADVAKGFADYQFWLGQRIGDAAEYVIGGNRGAGDAAYYLRDALNAAASAAGSVQSYQGGGIVPGPVGAPRLILAHGGEAVGRAAEVRERRRPWTNYGRINFYVTTAEPRAASREIDLMLRGA